MKSIHIRDIDEKILDSLKLLAEMHHRSLQGELHYILEETAKKASLFKNNKEFEITTVRRGLSTTWRREELYGNQDR